jgi:2-polyprenyl-3-methyl-5-hydroxy-6-metoxy-1,4-benzoquinol methylase
MDPREVVRRGYDALSYRYRADAEFPDAYAPWISSLTGRVPAGGTVLDVGCGCGIPVARSLADGGYAVTGVDLSPVQIARAKELVPGADFLCCDALDVQFPAGSFDAVVCLYALIHMPQDDQPELLRRIATWLRPGGWLLATTGATAWTGTSDGWLGGDAPMWWSHPDAAVYRDWIAEAGLTVTAEDFVPEGSSGHQLFWARN